MSREPRSRIEPTVPAGSHAPAQAAADDAATSRRRAARRSRVPPSARRRAEAATATVAQDVSTRGRLHRRSSVGSTLGRIVMVGVAVLVALVFLLGSFL